VGLPTWAGKEEIHELQSSQVVRVGYCLGSGGFGNGESIPNGVRAGLHHQRSAGATAFRVIGLIYARR